MPHQAAILPGSRVAPRSGAAASYRGEGPGPDPVPVHCT